jgi:thiamine pyrophosphokinase
MQGLMNKIPQEYEVVLLGGLSGRLDQTIHTLSFLHKLRTKRKQVFAVTDDNVGWVVDSVSPHASNLLLKNVN